MAVVVDSSVWINHIRDDLTPSVRYLRELDDLDVAVGDLVLFEVLQGARDEAHAARLERRLREFRIVTMVDDRVATEAARNFRILRSRGVTPRKPVDLLIAAYCILNDAILLHDDRDFAPMAAHLGLWIVPTDEDPSIAPGPR